MSQTIQTMELLTVITVPVIITLQQLLVGYYSEVPVFFKLEWITLALCMLYIWICASSISIEDSNLKENEESNNENPNRSKTMEKSIPKSDPAMGCSSKLSTCMTINLNDLQWRKSRDQGYWCTLLLPFVMITDGLYDKSVLNTLHISFINNILMYKILSHLKVETLSLKSIGLFTLIQQQGFLFGLDTMETLLVFIIFVVFQYSCVKLPQLLPLSFTSGENEVITQSAAIYLISVVYKLSKFDPTTYTIPRKLDEDQEIFFFTNLAVIGGAIVAVTSYLLGKWMKKFTLAFYPLLFTLIAIVTILLGYMMQQNPLMWLLRYLTDETHRQLLFLYWAVCSAVSAIIATVCYNFAKNKGSTIIRKYFHILAIIVFTPGILVDSKMLSVATSCVLVVVIVLECIRIIRVWPFGDAIHNAFQVFVDEKDGGIVILTHIYLLIGCAVPLWLSQKLQSEPPIALFSGIISIGIGDTTASIFGTKFGKTKWPNSKKSVEGTVAAIVLQGIFVIILLHSGWISFGNTTQILGDTLMPLLPNGALWIYRYLVVTIAIISTSLLEAFTSQIDNLVLPIFMYTILRCI
ncbi:unnamed protein product [Owenia fusiformis]|uniref:dolichol kinase n=1 Tax=Owenia fusiformis TaxID=6347 RepID=A0A8J1UEY0_OWEFU|nr:unnamed protein product [Owenia fusiformis]